MKRPTQTFTVTVCPSARVIGCAEKRDQEKRGLFGFHDFTRCPDCQVIPEGWEFWGENGHRQGGATTRTQLVFWIGRKAKEQWRMKAGGLMGYRFRKGETIYYAS
jgi:hypothetical protein